MYRIHGGGYRFATSGAVAYLAGSIRNSFDAVDGMQRNNLAAFNLSTKHFTNWNPAINKYVNVMTMAPSNGWLLIAGSFTDRLG